MYLLLNVYMFQTLYFPEVNCLFDFKFTFFYFLICISIPFELLANNNDIFEEIADKFPLRHLRLHFVAD